jgi:hypothetical protein
MRKILPLEQWSNKDKELLADLGQCKIIINGKARPITPVEAYEISWALFNNAQRSKKRLEEMSCRKCWEKNNPMSRKNYSRDKAQLRKAMKDAEEINQFFSPYHNLLGEKY